MSQAMAPPQVRVELYVKGKGPRHVFESPLKGWDQNRLDVEAILHAYDLTRLYAFSLATGRGNRLLFNPRSGLSHLTYSPKPDVIIRLDGDPKESYLWMLGKALFGILLVCGLAYVALSDSLPESVHRLRVLGGGHLTYLICFITIIYSQLIWRPLKKRRGSGG